MSERNFGAGFMAAMEADANERAARRREREEQAAKKKEAGNTYFKNGDFNNALRMYIGLLWIDNNNKYKN